MANRTKSEQRLNELQTASKTKIKNNKALRGSKIKVVAIDFDGVIAKYDGWKGESVVGEPLKGIKNFLLALSNDNAFIVIHTARSKKVVSDYMAYNNLTYNQITNEKLKDVSVFIDDRAYGFHPSDLESPKEFAKLVLNFKPYWDI